MSNHHRELEEGSKLTLDFDRMAKVADCGQALIPAVIQDAVSQEVLIVGFANREALEYARQNKVATLWSTSRNELWIKGATSGEYLDLVEVRVNCEQNSILYLVKIRSQGACHTKNSQGIPRLGCYYRKINDQGELEKIRD
ncbi:MAG: phosphoribosyl-AMP cyclohydrolase [Proteobacteria bacterium]|nr:phosphoribosyl-AMP cyclohydrolase [Pseudomonadota bacterium]